MIRKSRKDKVSQACDACRTRKTKCDAGPPSCTPCQDHGFTCSYTTSARPQNSRKRVRQSNPMASARRNNSGAGISMTGASALSQGCSEMDHSIDEQATPAQGFPLGAETATSAHHQSVERTSSGERQDAMDDVNIHTGSTEFHGSSSVLPFLSNLRLKARQTRIQQHPNSELTDPPTSISLLSYIHDPEHTGLSSNTPSGSPPQSCDASQLYGLAFEKQAVQLYFQNLHVVHPFLDQRTFIRRCSQEIWQARTLHNKPRSLAHSHFLALYNAVMAVGLITADDVSTMPEMTENPNSSYSDHEAGAQTIAEHYFKQAKFYLGDVFHSTSIDGTSALFLLSVYCQNTLRQHSCYLYSGMAVRTAIAVGVSSTTSKDSPFLGRLWWSIYSHEMEMCASVGRLTALEDPHAYDVRLPDPDADFPHALIAHMVRFAVILKQILHNGQQAAEFADTTARSYGTQAIYGKLKAWRDSLNPELDFDRPQLTDAPWRLQQKVVLKLRFLNASIVLHRPFLLLHTRDSSNPELGIHVNVCIEASITTIDTLYDSYLQRPSFRLWWYNAIYLLYASMVVLYALLIDVQGWSPATLMDAGKRGLRILETMESNRTAARITMVVREVLDIAVDFASSKHHCSHGLQAVSCQAHSRPQVPLHMPVSYGQTGLQEATLDLPSQSSDLDDLFSTLVDSNLFADWLQGPTNFSEGNL